MKKVLLVYATIEGQTEKIARTIWDHLQQAGASVTLVNAGDKEAAAGVNLQAFDLLVFGASIHAGWIEKSMASFINHHAADIEAMPRSMFIVLMAAAMKDPDRREKALADIRRNLAKQVKVPFPEGEMIAGALSYTKYNWLVKWLMKWISSKEGGETDTSMDYEYTDWEQVTAYAKRLA